MNRKPDREGGTLVFAGAFSEYRPSMQLYQLPHNGQTKTKASVCASGRHIGLPESVKYIRQEILSDPLACISHNDLYAGAGASQPDHNTTSLGRKLDRIGKEVPNHLLQS